VRAGAVLQKHAQALVEAALRNEKNEEKKVRRRRRRKRKRTRVMR